jgi:hypothetical protein
VVEAQSTQSPVSVVLAVAEMVPPQLLAHPYQLPEPQTPAVVAVVVRDLPAYHKPALQVDQELWFFLTDLF